MKNSEKSPQQQPTSKLVFENLRNLFVCISLAIAGFSITAFPELSPFGPKTAFGLSLIVVTVSSALMLWNAMSGGHELLRQYSMKSITFWAIGLPGFALYGALSFTVFGVAVKVQAQQIRQISSVEKKSGASPAISLPQAAPAKP